MSTTKTSKYYAFKQNNSFGIFKPPAIFLIVEANDVEEAMHIAEDHGAYFDGVGDCHCCGNRWYEPERSTEEPSYYGQPITDKEIEDARRRYAPLTKEANTWLFMIVYKDKPVEKIPL